MQLAVPLERRRDFAVVYDAHVDFVWSMVRRLGVRQEQVEDAVQDVFVVVHRQLPTFRGASSLKTWVGGIAVRVAQEYRRRARRAEACEPLESCPELHLQSGERSPYDVAEASQAWTLLERLLDTLDEDQRSVFVLSSLEGLSAPEIAQVVQAPLNTVYSRLRLARAKLERAVARSEGGAA